MLVLSRRESESIVFPELGITIEVRQLTRNQVRLGIVAPKQIRVFRSELEHQVEEGVVDSGQELTRQQLQKNLDAANLAIHLAQNQLCQGREENAEAALNEAVNCLQELETLLQPDRRVSPASLVRESESSYEVMPCDSTPAGKLSPLPQLALICIDETINPALPVEMLRAAGFETECVMGVRQLVAKYKQLRRPNVVLTPLVESGPEWDGYLFPLGTLMRREFPVMLGDQHLDGWFATEEDERRFEMTVYPRSH